MSRSVSEWVGKTDDAPVPPRVRLRVWDRFNGLCHRCGRKIAAGERWTCEHLKALINGGQNRESNLGITCSWCLNDKNAEDVAEKSKTADQRKAYLGIKAKSGRGIRGWRKFDGTPVYANERKP